MTENFKHIKSLIVKLKEKAVNGEQFNSDDKAAFLEFASAINSGKLRAAEKIGDDWQVNIWVKEALSLAFKFSHKRLHATDTNLHEENLKFENSHVFSYDLEFFGQKFSNWTTSDFEKHKIRVCHGAIVRNLSYISENNILMPCFINIGAYVDSGTMIDTFATIGSCAQIGKSCHISGGAGIGGVLEPAQSYPVIIEDDCFIGARSEVVEGVRICKGSVLAMGVYIGMSTKIIDVETGEIMYGKVPPYSVVIPGSRKINDSLSAYCALIIKKVDEKTKSKTSINELLRTYS